MEVWFLQDIPRLNLERNAIRCLEETVEWLVGTDWILDAGLSIDAVIRTHGHDYEVRLSYPALFPSVPPAVRPKNPDQRWSNHQYSDGTLCLEWGPDTWHPDVTGAQVLESVHKLLDIEDPLGSGTHKVVPSRHHLSIGQELRDKYGRFYVGNKLAPYLKALSNQAKGLLDFSIQWQSKTFLVLIQIIRPTKASAWEDTSIPQGVRGSKGKGTIKTGVFYKTDLDSGIIRKIGSVKEIEKALAQAGHGGITLAGKEHNYIMGLTRPPSGVLLLDAYGEPHFFLTVFDQNGGKAYRLATIQSDESATVPRAPADLQGLSGKSVGIVGLGSVGGRLALPLARAGVSRFFLVDEDVFLPENICRHVLDWQNVGEHKVDAIAAMLSRIASNIEIETSRLTLTGQESTASLSGTLNKLGRCDLIVDATANSKVFNLLADMATTYAKPLVWIEVYAGGVGGMIARSRPERDPDPHSMRGVYNQFTSENPAPDLSVVSDYTVESDEGEVLTASDTDVGILAYHGARLAIDTLLERKPSIFPYSMYLVGLDRSWVFKEPFDTIPIKTNHLRRKKKSDPVEPEVLSENLEFIAKLVDGIRSENSSS